MPGASRVSAKTKERLDVTVQNAPQLRVAYLTAWSTGQGPANFRNDIYGLDGTGFVVGQPLPEGELSDDGQRYILKPLPVKATSTRRFRKMTTAPGPSRRKPKSSARLRRNGQTVRQRNEGTLSTFSASARTRRCEAEAGLHRYEADATRRRSRRPPRRRPASRPRPPRRRPRRSRRRRRRRQDEDDDDQDGRRRRRQDQADNGRRATRRQEEEKEGRGSRCRRDHTAGREEDRRAINLGRRTYIRRLPLRRIFACGHWCRAGGSSGRLSTVGGEPP